MAYSKSELRMIWKKTDCRCHLCWRRLRLSSYGLVDERDAWEIDHSNARANGGTDRKGNLQPACIGCNRGKQAESTRSVRRQNGFGRSPMSAEEKGAARAKSALGGGALGATAGGLMFGPPGAIIGGLLGGLVGGASDPEDRGRL